MASFWLVNSIVGMLRLQESQCWLSSLDPSTCLPWGYSGPSDLTWAYQIVWGSVILVCPRPKHSGSHWPGPYVCTTWVEFAFGERWIENKMISHFLSMFQSSCILISLTRLNQTHPYLRTPYFSNSTPARMKYSDCPLSRRRAEISSILWFRSRFKTHKIYSAPSRRIYSEAKLVAQDKQTTDSWRINDESCIIKELQPVDLSPDILLAVSETNRSYHLSISSD